MAPVRQARRVRYGSAPLRNEFVLVVSFRNQTARILRCLQSVLDSAPGAGLVIIDDASDDGSGKLVLDFLAQADVDAVFVQNAVQNSYLQNLHYAVTELIDGPETVVLELDGDDYLESVNVLEILRERYAGGIWQTFGSFRILPSEDEVWNATLEKAREKNDPRYPWDLTRCAAWMHLRTFKKHLFESVPRKYFFERNSERWVTKAEDLCVHPKMMELARGKVAYVDQCVYVYDVSGPNHNQFDPERERYIVQSLYRVPSSPYIDRLRARYNVREESSC